MTKMNNAVAFTSFEPGATPTTEQIEAKARELLAQLTLDEKLGMMDGDIAFWPGMAEMMGGGYGDHPWPAGINDFLFKSDIYHPHQFPGIEIIDSGNRAGTGTKAADLAIFLGKTPIRIYPVIHFFQ